MARLFEMSNEFSKLFDKFDELNEMTFDVNEFGEPIDENGNVIDPIEERDTRLKLWYLHLVAIEEDFKTKAENIAQYIKHLDAEAEMIDKEIKNLTEKKALRKKKAEEMKKYLFGEMKFINLRKIDGIRAKLSIRNNAPALKIENEAEFIDMLQRTDRDYLLKYSEPTIRKSEIKALIKNGETFEGASLESSESLIIK